MKVEKQVVEVKPSFKLYQIVITIEDKTDELDVRRAQSVLDSINRKGFVNYIKLADHLKSVI